MRRSSLLFTFLIFVAQLGTGQSPPVAFVTVTGSNANYPNGTIAVNFQPPPNTAQSSYSGQRFSITQTVSLNASGAWSFQVADNTTLFPARSMWQLNLCSQGTYKVPPTCYLVTMPVTCVGNGSCSGSTLDLTSAFSAAPVPPGSGGGSVVLNPNLFAAVDSSGHLTTLPETATSTTAGVTTIACQEDHLAGIYDPRCPRYAGGVYGPTPNAAAQAMSNQMVCDLATGVVHYARAQWPQGNFNIDQLVIAPGSDWEGIATSEGGTFFHSIYNNHQIVSAPSSMTVTCNGTPQTLTQGQTMFRHFTLQGCGVGGCTNAPGDTGTYADGGPSNTGVQMSNTAGHLEYSAASNFGGYGFRIDGQDTKAFHNTASNNLEWFYFSNGAYKGVNETLTSPETSATTTGTTSSVTLNWAAVTGATGYVVYRGTTPGGENVFYQTTTNSFTDTGAANNGASPAGFAYNNAPATPPGTITPTVSSTGGTLAAGTYYYTVTASTVDGWHGSVEFAGADDMADWLEVYGFFDGATQFTFHHLADILGGGGDSHFDHLWPQLGMVGIAQPFGAGGGDHYENVRIDFARLEGFWSTDVNVYVDGGSIDGSCTSPNAVTINPLGICTQLYMSNGGGGITSVFFSDNNGFGPTYKTADYYLTGGYRHGINGSVQYTSANGQQGGTNYEPASFGATNVTGPQPSVAGLYVLNPNDTTPTTYTGFLHSQPGQVIWVQTGNANVTIANNSPYLLTCNGQSINLGTVSGILQFQANGAYGLFGLPAQVQQVCTTAPTVQSSETVTFSATPTFSLTTRSSIITLTAAITSFTLPAGIDGQEKTLVFCQNGTGGFTAAAPANVHGFFTIGATANKCSTQHFTYSAGQTAWLADSPGVTNE